MGDFTPTLLPLGDAALLVRFAETLDEAANRAAIEFASSLSVEPTSGIVEIVPNLVSVLVRYDPAKIGFSALAGEVRLRLSRVGQGQVPKPTQHELKVQFGGEAGPDLQEVADSLNLKMNDFIARHNGASLRVLATGFAPGFIYCGMHSEDMHLPRRQSVRPMVPAGTVLFAAGQTAITSTPIPTGWHVIGRTDFVNFDATQTPATKLSAGDEIRFVGVAS